MYTDQNFCRYLSSKKSVDDRALNAHVWDKLLLSLPEQPRILEIGAGIGTMLERFIEKGVFSEAHYTAIDKEVSNIEEASRRLEELPDGIILNLEATQAMDFISQHQGECWDLIVAHAFLDLMDVKTFLPALRSLLAKDGLGYFTINFDGVTTFEPCIDPVLDAHIIQLYHQNMDQRIIDGKVSGDSQCGRHLFAHLHANDFEILAAGGSNWLIYAGKDGYIDDEAYFLHFIIDTVYSALKDHADLDSNDFLTWVQERHAQIERNELVYITHQLDVLVRSP